MNRVLFRTILQFLPVLLLLGTLPVGSTTLYVDPPNANGTTIFASLNEAAEYLVNNSLDVDGEPDEILVLVNNLVVGASPDGAVRYTGTDDLLIDGDGDGDGVWCTLVVSENIDFNGTNNLEGAFFRIERTAISAWTANVTIRNFVMIPEFQSAGAVTSVARRLFSHALGSHIDTAGTILFENVVMTGSLPGNVPANPFVNERANATLWFGGLHTGSKATNNPDQAFTLNIFRNVILSYSSGFEVDWYGDNVDAVFGPGFIISNTVSTNPVMIRNTAYHNRFYFTGTAENRNLFYRIGDQTTDRAINADNSAAEGTWIVEVAYTDFIDCMARQLMRLSRPLGKVDNCIFAQTLGAGSGNIELLAGSATPSMTISNSTFFNTGPNANARHISGALYGNTAYFQNVVFAAAAGEVIADNTNADIAFNLDSTVDVSYCLFPESGPYRLKEPYDDVFPPSPPKDAAYLGPFASDAGWTLHANNSNLDPQFLSDVLTDYPVPANAAAWQAQKITLEGVNYLRPGNPALEAAGPGGVPLYGAYTAYYDSGEITPYAEGPGFKIYAGPKEDIYDQAESVLGVSASNGDLIAGDVGTITLGGFHPATAGDASNLTNGTFDPNGLTVIGRDTDGSSDPSLIIEYDFSTSGEVADVTGIRIFSGHDGDGARVFLNVGVEVDLGAGYVSLGTLMAGTFGLAAPGQTAVAYAEWTGSQAGVQKIRFIFENVSHNSTGFFQAPDDNITNPPAAYPNQSTVIKEIDVFGAKSLSVKDWGLY